MFQIKKVNLKYCNKLNWVGFVILFSFSREWFNIICNRLIYLKVGKIFKEGTDNQTLDNKHGQKGLTDAIKVVKKGNTKYKEILIDTKRVEIPHWKTIKERWVIDDEGVDKGLREKAVQVLYCIYQTTHFILLPSSVLGEEALLLLYPSRPTQLDSYQQDSNTSPYFRWTIDLSIITRCASIRRTQTI